MSDVPKDPNEVWANTIDQGKYGCRVYRIRPSLGLLTVWVSASQEQLLSTEVTISFDAPFGPDVGDVELWKDMVISTIDRYEDEGKASDGHQEETTPEGDPAAAVGGAATAGAGDHRAVEGEDRTPEGPPEI